MDRTITALYDTKDQAEAAKHRVLETIGDADAHIDISSSDSAGSAGEQVHRASHEAEGFMDKVKHFFMADEDRDTYSEGMRRGGYLLTARVDEASADAVCNLLEQTGPVDIEARQQEWAASGWEGRGDGASSTSPTGASALGDTDRIQVAEERFKLGKREVERGTVRVRSYIEQQPVHEQIELERERVDVDRHPVERTLSPSQAEGLFQERTIEMTERSEEPVIAKETVVTEEIALRKQADHRTETIDDNVRRTRVDIEDDRGQRGENSDRLHRGQMSASEEERSFSTDDHSVSMDPTGTSARETDEERRRRLQDDPEGKPSPL